MRRIGIACLMGSLAVLFAAKPALAAEYYVATDGDDDNSGSVDAPFASVERGEEEASAGDTIWVRGGTYAFSSGTVGVSFTKPGQANNLIHYFAYPGETPVFDLSAINPSGRVTGFDVHTNYVHIRGMEVTGVPQYAAGEDSWGLRIQGSNNIIELMNVHHNEAPGIFITSGANNLILNCDSHDNYDVLEGGGSGDGFGCHSTGTGNILRGCRGWANSDDGYDFINAPGACTVEYSWAWENGYDQGNGAGFKAGGFGTDTSTFPENPPRHVVHHCVSWANKSQGFYANHHPGALDFLNNTAYDNPRNYDMLDDFVPGTHRLRNNVAYGSGGNLSNSTSDDSQSNSWDGGVSVSDADFQSLSDAGADGARGSDGSLPNIAFFHLAAGSDLIDAGEDVGLDYNDAAPDLGAFETGDVVTTTSTTAGVTTATTTGSTATTTSAGTTDGGSTTTGAVTGGTTAGTLTGASGTTATTGVTDASTSATGTTGPGTTGLGTTGTGMTGVSTGSAAAVGGVTGTTTAGASGVAGPTAGTTGFNTTGGTPPPVTDDGGCSCSVPLPGGAGPGALVLAALGGVLAGRRRRRPC